MKSLLILQSTIDLKKEVTPYQRENQEKKEQVEEMFDAIAPNYDRLNRILSMRIDQRWRKNVIRMLEKQQPSSILDIATGTGDLAIAMAKLKANRLVGLDLSEKMLRIAKEKIAKHNLSVDLVKGDSENLPFNNESFEAITCAFGVRNFGDLKAGLQEMHRVLDENGQLLILEFSKPKNKIFQKLYYFYFFNVLPFVGRILSGDERAYTYLPESVNEFPSGEQFADILKESGFKTVLCKPQTFGICTIYQARK